jgi:leucyl/phenylalanyl-tRNA--protein transferase
MIPWLLDDDPFPPIERALAEPSGLLCAGASLSVARLLDAYSRGIFPWMSEGDPVLWWSPDPRMILLPAEFRPARSLRRRLARGDYEVRADTAFREVMRACARIPRRGQRGTWITGAMLAAYGELHARGYAHSVETWIDGRLAGGLYGVAIGGVFFGESMFARVTDASKIAFAHLVEHLLDQGYDLIDCQVRTAHLESLGAREVPRADFIRRLELSIIRQPTRGHWSIGPRSWHSPGTGPPA